MAEDGIGACAEEDSSGGQLYVPGGDQGRLLHHAEQFLLLLESAARLAARPHAAEEDYDALVGGTHLEGEPEVEGSG